MKSYTRTMVRKKVNINVEEKTKSKRETSRRQAPVTER
jgi:hypothetical protein